MKAAYEKTSCNCKEKNRCQLEGNCPLRNIVYMATMKTETNSLNYVGMTENDFKTRYYNHLKSLMNKRYKNETEMSKYIWNLIEKVVEHAIRAKSCINLSPANGSLGDVSCASI